MSPCLLPPRKFFIHCHTFATFQIDFFKTQSEFDLHSWCLACDCVCSPAVKRVRQSDWDVGRQSFFKWQPVVCMTWTLAGRMKLKAHSSSRLKGEKTDQMTCFFLESKTNRGFICDSCGFSQGFESMLLCLICKSVIRRLLFITFSASLSALQMDFLNHFSDYTFVLTAVLKQCGFISSAVRFCVVSLWKRNKKNWCEIWTDLPVSPASLSDWGCEWLKVSAVMRLLLRFLRSSSYTLSRDRDVNDSGAGRYGSKLNSWMWDFLFFLLPPFHLFLFAFISLLTFLSWKPCKAIVSILIDRERYTDRCLNCLFQQLSCCERRTGWNASLCIWCCRRRNPESLKRYHPGENTFTVFVIFCIYLWCEW